MFSLWGPAGWTQSVRKALEGVGAELVPVATNPIDAVWDDRPEPSTAPAVVLDVYKSSLERCWCCRR